MTHLSLAVEDFLSEFVMKEIIRQEAPHIEVTHCYGKGGYGYLKTKISAFNQASQYSPFLVLTDLDNSECAPTKIKKWLPTPIHPNLLFRVAVKEIESWVLADRTAFAHFLGISPGLIPENTDEQINNPKEFLISLARKSRKSSLRERLVPAERSTAKVGPDYNGTLISFVNSFWKAKNAIMASSSLERTVKAVKNFRPQS